MLPRIEAEERMASIDGIALGMGSYPKAEARQMVERLKRAARGGARLRGARADPGALARMGIGVVPAKGQLSDV